MKKTKSGKFFRPKLVQVGSKFDETVQNLTKANHLMDKVKICAGCGSTGDFFCCQGCFSLFYCSEVCQKMDWVSGHKQDCPCMSAKIVGDGAKLPPLGSTNLIAKYRRATQTIQQLLSRIDDLKSRMKDSKEEAEYLLGVHEKDTETITDLREEISALEEAKKKANKEKAGKASAFMRLKRKFSEIDEESDIDIPKQSKYRFD